MLVLIQRKENSKTQLEKTSRCIHRSQFAYKNPQKFLSKPSQEKRLIIPLSINETKTDLDLRPRNNAKMVHKNFKYLK